MATIFVFNNRTGDMERYTLDGGAAMPYNEGGTLTVREFLKGADVGWTDTATMEAFNAFRGYYGKPVVIVKGFVEVGDEAPDEKQHYVGAAFVLRPAAGNSVQELYRAAVDCGAWAVVTAPKNGTITVDARHMPSSTFITRGFPTLARGASGNHVLLLQRMLNHLGFDAGAEDGRFGPDTEAAVRAMQTAFYLTEDGIIAYLEWDSILAHADRRAGEDSGLVPDGSGGCSGADSLYGDIDTTAALETYNSGGDCVGAQDLYDVPELQVEEEQEVPACGCTEDAEQKRSRTAPFWG